MATATRTIYSNTKWRHCHPYIQSKKQKKINIFLWRCLWRVNIIWNAGESEQNTTQGHRRCFKTKLSVPRRRRRSYSIDPRTYTVLCTRAKYRCQPTAQPCRISIEAVQCRIYLGELRSLSVLDHFHDGRSKQALPGGPRLLTPTHFWLSFKRVDKIQQLWRIQFTANEMLDFMSIKLNSSKTTSYTNTLYLHSLYFWSFDAR